jgi:bacteriochlorophyllide a dehydrogenase
MISAHGAVAEAAYKVVYRSVEVPDPGPEDIVVAVDYSWISNGTEGSFVRGERIGGDTPRTESDPMPFPHISGYQKTGSVVAVGPAVKPEIARIGDAVFATVSKVAGMFYDHAGHISPAVTHQSQIYRLPEGADPIDYCGLVLTQVGYNVGMSCEVQPGDYAVVIGDGMVGHWSAQTLQSRGAHVMLVGRHAERLGLFDPRDGGCTVNETAVDVVEAVKDWARKGIAVVADTVGSIDSVYALMPMMKHRGWIVSAGFYGSQGQIDIQRLRIKELRLSAPSGWAKVRLQETMDLISNGHIKTRHLISEVVPVELAGQAFQRILSKEPGLLGVVLDWRGSKHHEIA